MGVNATEAAHQNALLQALFRQGDTVLGASAPIDTGLAAYRNNGSANATRAMALLFPAVYALLGEDDFAPLARLHWLAQPPQRGDWSQYGGGLGDWIAAHNPGGVLDALPFLPDLARLDYALSHCQDVADATPDLATLALLEQDPSTLRMVLHPSVAALLLAYDVVDFRQALLADTTLPSPLVSTLIQPQSATKHVLIARHAYRAQAKTIDTPSAAFVRNCVAGTTVLQAHDAATAIDPAFDVSAWLSDAITAQWIVRVECI